MKKALIYETREESRTMLLANGFVRDDAVTQKKYYSDGYLEDGTIILYEANVKLK